MIKYKLTEETTHDPYTDAVLYRIQALRNFGDVREGDLGGFVESEMNLSHEGKCWIYDDVMVFDKASVRHDAKVFGECQIFDSAVVAENAHIDGKFDISDKMYIGGGTDDVINGIESIYDPNENINDETDVMNIMDKKMKKQDEEIYELKKRETHYISIIQSLSNQIK